MEGNDIERSDRLRDIQNTFAFELFCQRRFEESFKNFSKVGTGELFKLKFMSLNGPEKLLCISDPSQVIGLFPDLLPDSFRKCLKYPSDPPKLTGSQLEKGITALIGYLTEVI